MASMGDGIEDLLRKLDLAKQKMRVLRNDSDAPSHSLQLYIYIYEANLAERRMRSRLCEAHQAKRDLGEVQIAGYAAPLVAARA